MWKNIPARCVSLEKNSTRWPHIVTKLENLGFTDVKISQAVYGAELEHPFEHLSVRSEMNMKSRVERTSHEDFSTLGAIGCYLSHVNLWKELASNPYWEKMVIVEEDVMFFKGFEQNVVTLHLFDAQYNMLLLGSNKRQNIVADDAMPWTRYTQPYFGTYAYILTKNGARTLLKRCLPIEMHVEPFGGVGQRANARAASHARVTRSSSRDAARA